MNNNFMSEGSKPDIFEYLASLNDKELMNNFYSDPSCCLCTFRFLHPILQGIIYKLLFLGKPVDMKTLKKWPQAKNDDATNTQNSNLKSSKDSEALPKEWWQG